NENPGASVIQHTAGDEIVEAACHRDQAVDDRLAVVAAIERVDPVPGVEAAEALQRGIFVVEQFDENILQLAGLRGGGEERTDPAVIGAEATAGRLGGGVE